MNNKSFTLIELLVVIVIIGILAGVIIVSTASFISKANIAKIKVFENNIQNELGANMVSRWKLDETSGVTTPEAWGDNTGGLGDGATSSTYPTLKTEAECVTDKCMSFDGGDYIQILGTSVSTTNLAITGAITLSGWIKSGRLNTNESLFGRGIGMTNVGNYGYFVSKNLNNGFQLDIYNVGVKFTLSSPVSIIDTNWHFVVATWDGTTNDNGANLYLDGILKNTGKSTITSIGQPNFNFTIGISGDKTTRPFVGFVDDIRIYNGAICSSQIKQEYVAGLNSLLANNNISKEEYNLQIESLASK